MAKTKTKAVVLYEANERMPLVTLTQEAPRQGEIKIRVGAAGICASDHHIMNGTANFPLPMVLGHEGAGVVEAVGEGVSRFKIGDRCVLSFVSFCGHCESCRNGAAYMCDTHRETGGYQKDKTTRLLDQDGLNIRQFGKLGVFAESAIVPEESCFKMPDKISFEEAAVVGCAVSTGVGATFSQNILPGDSVAIFGAGGVGLACVMGAKALGASKIVVVDIKDDKLKFAKEFGATHTLNATKDNTTDKIKEISPLGVKWGFDSFGSKKTTETMYASLAKLGVGVVIGLAPEGTNAQINIVDLTRNEKTIKGSYYGSTHPFASFERVFKLIENGTLDIKKLIKRTYPLDKINEAYADLESGHNGRGVLTFNL